VDVAAGDQQTVTCGNGDFTVRCENLSLTGEDIAFMFPCVTVTRRVAAWGNCELAHQKILRAVFITQEHADLNVFAVIDLNRVG